VKVAKSRTADADMKLDERGKKVAEDPTQMDLGGNVLIVDPAQHEAAINRVSVAEDVEEEIEEGEE
jgi:hypothetical protein